MEKDFIFNWAILKIFVNFAQKNDGGGKTEKSQRLIQELLLPAPEKGFIV